ncbi:MAG: hypothetical protein FWJ70_01885 [Micromonosporaceae bacterium]|jgi:hypothetical protein
MTDTNIAQELLEKIREFFRHVFSSEQNTQLFLQDPEGAFGAHEIDPSMLANVDIAQLVNSCAYPSGSSGGSGGSGGAGGGGGGGAGGYVPPPQTVQQVTQVTQNFYQDNSTNIDNSVTVHAEKGSHVDVDTTNVTATGERSVAVGDDVEDSQLNTGDGAVQAGRDIEAPVNTGVNTGIMADGSVEDVVMGDNSGAFAGDDLKFAQGDLVDQEGATDSMAVTGDVGGDAVNANDLVTAAGSAVNIGGEGGGATGNYASAHDGSVVGTEQGEGDFEQTEDSLDLDVHLGIPSRGGLITESAGEPPSLIKEAAEEPPSL